MGEIRTRDCAVEGESLLSVLFLRLLYQNTVQVSRKKFCLYGCNAGGMFVRGIIKFIEKPGFSLHQDPASESRFVILLRLMANVDTLCSSAVVVDGKIPNAPITIRKELKEMILL